MNKTSEQAEKTEKKRIIWQLVLIILPWLIFWLQPYFWPSLLRLFLNPFIDPPIKVRLPVFIHMAPFAILLIVGIIVAWKQNFPSWSYTWIGILYFFVYREVFQIVIILAPSIMPEHPDLIINGFYLIVNPLALAFLLAIITRRARLLASFTAFPFTSIIMAWYTLDRTPLYILSISLFLYGLFSFLFLLLSSPTLRFSSLLAGTLIIGGGFFLLNWDLLIGGWQGFLLILGRNVLILVFPLIIYRIPLYRKVFKTDPVNLVNY